MNARGLLYFSVLLTTLASFACKHQSNAEDTAAGTSFKTLYAENCSGCHGIDGRYGPGRPIRDPVLLGIMNHDNLWNVIYNGRPGTPMPAFGENQAGTLSNEQIGILVTGIERNWKTKIATTGVPPYHSGLTGDVLNGKRVFARACFMCHGPGRPIGAVTDPAYLSVTSDQGLRDSVIVGRADFGMPNWKYLNAGRPLSDQDVTDVVSYLASLRPPTGLQTTTGAGPEASQNPAPGQITSGAQGSGNGPGSPTQNGGQGNLAQGSSSIQGGAGSGSRADTTRKATGNQ